MNLNNLNEFIPLFNFLTHILFVVALGFYLITNLQWYHYKIVRVVTKHHKNSWHFIYFVLPVSIYLLFNNFFWIFFYFAYLPYLIIWHRRLDKKLVNTWRVKRFFFILISLTIFQDIICLVKNSCANFGVFMPLIATTIGTMLIEKLLFFSYYKQAERKLRLMSNTKVIAITGSYGKTSIKNYLTQILSRKYKVYATPKSVNTIEGIVKDINTNLKAGIDFYIVEAGARERGDIEKIAKLVQEEIAIVSKIGEQHIEYFKSIDNIVATKLEIVNSQKLKHLYLHSSINRERLKTDNLSFQIDYFGEGSSKINSDLYGTKFRLEINNQFEWFETQLLGKFQSENLEVVIKIALEFGFSLDEIQFAIYNLKPVPHRLEKIKAGGKIIIDDGYNGNIDGMLEAFRLVESYDGRKIIITPGLIESNETLNERVAFEIDDIFDIVIITGSLNRDFFKRKLVSTKAIRVFLDDKSKLEKILSQYTKDGDIILFANDAPSFI